MSIRRTLLLTAAATLALATSFAGGQATTSQPASTVPLSVPPSEDPPTYSPTLTFDVASIREAQRVNGLAMNIDDPPHASAFRVTGIPLQYLIQLAYGFGPFQVSGAPDWVNGMYVTVQAKSDPYADALLAKLPDDQARLEKRHMLQALLADRLQLKTHWEQRPGSGFNLVLAKGGPKLQPTKVDPAEPDDPSHPAPVANALGPEVHAGGSSQGRVIECRRFTMRSITAMLGTQLKAPVVDRTGLTGTYDFTIQFNADNSSEPDAYPTLFSAIQEQLGLKLESAKGPLDTLVIDHVERPSEN
jgi:uncharacterized protein (TIGR03435 family)